MPNPFESPNFESPKAESFILKDTEAANWLEQRELYDPIKQTPPKEIFIITLNEDLAAFLGMEKKIITAQFLIDFLHTHKQAINISPIEENAHLYTGIKIIETKQGTSTMSIAFPMKY